MNQDEALGYLIQNAIYSLTEPPTPLRKCICEDIGMRCYSHELEEAIRVYMPHFRWKPAEPKDRSQAV